MFVSLTTDVRFPYFHFVLIFKRICLMYDKFDLKFSDKWLFKWYQKSLVVPKNLKKQTVGYSPVVLPSEIARRYRQHMRHRWRMYDKLPHTHLHIVTSIVCPNTWSSCKKTNFALLEFYSIFISQAIADLWTLWNLGDYGTVMVLSDGTDVRQWPRGLFMGRKFVDGKINASIIHDVFYTLGIQTFSLQLTFQAIHGKRNHAQRELVDGTVGDALSFRLQASTIVS